MTDEFPSADGQHYELRFESLFQPGRAIAFPCDREGHVDCDHFSGTARTSYIFARAMVGREYKWPRVAVCPAPALSAASAKRAA
jgi:hypothetical protein